MSAAHARAQPTTNFAASSPIRGWTSYPAKVASARGGPCHQPRPGPVSPTSVSAARTALASGPVIVWINGTHGAGKTTTSALVQPLIPDSRVFDAEKVGGTLMDIKPGLPKTDNFQHWPPWRPLVVETARRVLDYTGGTLVMPMTVLIKDYWREISAGFAQHGIPVRHFVLHADQDTLRRRIESDETMRDSEGRPSGFRLAYLGAYAEAAGTWLHNEAEVVDTTHVTPAQAARQIADAVKS